MIKKLDTEAGVLIKKIWHFMNKFPKGNWLFSKMAGLVIPYTGSISPVVLKIENGEAEVKLQDRRKVRNHLQSVHAIALANLGEFTTGLSLISQLEKNAKAILTKIEVVYLKKARGVLIAKANYISPPLNVGDSQHVITANITNANEELVCQVSATWQVRIK